MASQKSNEEMVRMIISTLSSEGAVFAIAKVITDRDDILSYTMARLDKILEKAEKL